MSAYTQEATQRDTTVNECIYSRSHSEIYHS